MSSDMPALGDIHSYAPGAAPISMDVDAATPSAATAPGCAAINA